VSYEGTWDLTIQSPMGAKTFRLAIQAGAGGLQGTSTTSGVTTPMERLREEDGRLRWSMKMPPPMNVVLEVEAAPDGDGLKGSAQAGRMALPEVRGVRVG
jgi:aminoglycoside phosphotransferase